MVIKKYIFIGLGLIFTGLAGVGAVVPFLPTFPFLMLAIYFFAKSSERLHNWLINTKLYQNNFKSYVEDKSMTKKTKIKILSTFTLVIGFALYMMRNVPYGTLILLVVWIAHVVYFVFGVKTSSENNM